MTPTTIIVLMLLVFALALLPDRYKPTWIYRLNWWQVLIGLVATVAAFVIIMNPEFYALGIIADSTFFDLLAMAIGIQLQMILSRIGSYAAAGGARVVRFINWRLCVTGMMLALVFDDAVSVVQRVVQRISP